MVYPEEKCNKKENNNVLNQNNEQLASFDVISISNISFGREKKTRLLIK